MPGRLYCSLLCLLCFTAPATAARYTFDYNNNCSRAYKDILSLRFTDAHRVLLGEVRNNPFNLMATYIADYEDCLLLLMNADSKEYAARAPHLEQRLALIDKADDRDPWRRICKAGIYLHWALIHMRMGEQYKAALEFRKSFLQLKENQRLFPRFVYNNVLSGIEETVVGTIPGNYKWLASVLGMKGNIKDGMARLDAFVSACSDNEPLHMEAVLFDVYLKFYLQYRQKDVWELLNSPLFQTDSNLLYLFVKADIALNYRKADVAAALLEQGSLIRGFDSYPIFNYQLGNALLASLDINCANYYERFLKSTRGQLYVKDTWQKMAYAWYVKGDDKKAEECKSAIRQAGNAQIDADKQAERFAENNAWPQRDLLRARLLIDGGYTSQALDILTRINPSSLANPADRTEYFFRLARAYDESGDDARARQEYQAAIAAGKDRHEHFAARAALQMGMLYERTGAYDEALKWYRQCLGMPSHDFQNSIDQQAKAGINRMESR